MNRPIGIALALTVSVTSAWAGSSERIHLDQVGFATGYPKLAISLDTTSVGELIDSASGQAVFTASLGAPTIWAAAADTCRIFDFTSIDRPGTYFVKIGTEISHPIRIVANPFTELARGSIKAFWFNRASYELPAEFAGKWARIAGHPDTAVLVHSSAATANRPTGTVIRSPGGWYDAGDYGKYIVNSGISTWTLLHLYERLPGYFDTLSLHVPGHAGKSDLVDEILWNLRWMLTMQDPNDGGAYHKLTTAQFSGFIMPDSDKAVRYAVQKSTAATLDLAATAATAARVFANIPTLTGLVDSCRTAALAGWTWARKNPEVYYAQKTMNATFTPAIGTGEYGDADVSDEFAWAASELFLLTGVDSFALSQDLAGQIGSATTWSWPSWNGVAALGWIDLLDHPSRLTGSLEGRGSDLLLSLKRTTSPIRSFRKTSGYRIPQGGFYWGGNSAFANNGMLLWEAWKATKDTSYLVSSLDALDYLLGRNPTGFSYVTGFGSKPPMNPHHRPSFADTVVAPEPGFLVGGPNSGQEDKCKGYPSTLGPKSYLDQQPCYAVNEVAINWNAPLAFLAGVWSAHLDKVPEETGVRSSTTRSDRGQLAWSRQGTNLVVSWTGKPLSRIDLVAPNGQILSSTAGSDRNLSLSTTARGLVFLKARALDGSRSSTALILE